MSLQELLETLSAQRRQEDDMPTASMVVDMMRRQLLEFHPKVFQPGDTVTYVEGMDKRHPAARHLPMVVVRMRDDNNPEDQHSHDCPGSKAAHNVMVLALTQPDVTDYGWEESTKLRLWTPEIGERIRMMAKLADHEGTAS